MNPSLYFSIAPALLSTGPLYRQSRKIGPRRASDRIYYVTKQGNYVRVVLTNEGFVPINKTRIRRKKTRVALRRAEKLQSIVSHL